MKTNLRLFTICVLSLVLSPLSAQMTVEPLGLAGKSITSLGVYGPVIVAGTNGEGVYYLDAADLPDTNWAHLGLEGKHVSAVYPHKAGPIGWGITAGVFPAEGDSVYVYCSHMGGEFTPNSAGISDTFAVGVYSLAGFPDPTICGEKYAATGGALYRQQFGDTLWEPLYTSIDAEGWGIQKVRTTEFVGGLVMVGGSAGYTGVLLMKSTDYGETWEHLYPPGPAYEFDFDVDSAFADVENIFIAAGDLIYSRDGGVNWDVPLWDFPIYDKVAIDPWSSLVTASGCAVSTVVCDNPYLDYSLDLGASWQPAPFTLPGPIIAMVLPGDGHLYFAAADSGVYRVALTTLSVDETAGLPRSISLYPNYPNPFNPATTVRFKLHAAAYIDLIVYDILGREITRLVSGYQPPGYHEAIWDGSDASGRGMPSGIYIARLSTPGYSQSRKIVLLR
ncbi:MAG: T9SS type A sorting domain-containing protein [Fidelibacterota bacterium]|nr:MAG: T9SS type A sorting domain-containing protein [Candidatus Neomarinimicrobiota bacterium]